MTDTLLGMFCLIVDEVFFLYHRNRLFIDNQCPPMRPLKQIEGSIFLMWVKRNFYILSSHKPTNEKLTKIYLNPYNNNFVEFRRARCARQKNAHPNMHGKIQRFD